MHSKSEKKADLIHDRRDQYEKDPGILNYIQYLRSDESKTDDPVILVTGRFVVNYETRSRTVDWSISSQTRWPSPYEVITQLWLLYSYPLSTPSCLAPTPPVTPPPLSSRQPSYIPSHLDSFLPASSYIIGCISDPTDAYILITQGYIYQPFPASTYCLPTV